jgi:hypothetical protein
MFDENQRSMGSPLILTSINSINPSIPTESYITIGIERSYQAVKARVTHRIEYDITGLYSFIQVGQNPGAC